MAKISHDVVLDAVRKAWDKLPELRFGQLIVNVLGSDPFYELDKNVVIKMRKYERKIGE